MKNKTIREAWQKASSLQQSGTDSPQFEAEYMMRRLLGVERATFFCENGRSLAKASGTQIPGMAETTWRGGTAAIYRGGSGVFWAGF